LRDFRIARDGYDRQNDVHAVIAAAADRTRRDNLPQTKNGGQFFVGRFCPSYNKIPKRGTCVAITVRNVPYDGEFFGE